VIVGGMHYIDELRYIIAGLIIVFFVGIKDDILVIDPYKKLAGQIIAAIIIAVFADIRITNLYGLLYIHQLPYIISILLTVFVFIVIINGFNLIDGIDGLASGVGIITSTTFGAWFWMNGYISYAIFSFSFVGSLSAFFWLNVFGKKNKIFLGDTGSLVTGFVMAVLACSYLKLELPAHGVTTISSAPSVVCGILIIPLFDSLRVFILRILQGKSPFKADRQHLHHRLLELKYTHLKATLILLSVNLFFIVLSYSLRGLGVIKLIVVIAGLACCMSFLLVFFARLKTQNAFEAILSSFEMKEGINIIKREKDKKSKKNVHVHPVKRVKTGVI
jgi:UDP-N-acetylmuramyl pentapeptide phosphotransferase/UDP-N-acetylglucosamine-1-phosphate transferase